VIARLRRHGPEYLSEALALGLFMLSASVFTAWIERPGSSVRAALPDGLARRSLIGLAMGATAVALIYSPFGKRSGAHMNPAVTLTFWRLGKVSAPDAAFYVLFQLAGGLLGLAAAAVLLGPALGDPAVRWVVTVPGARGAGAAFVAELSLAFVLMLVVLRTSADPARGRFTGLWAGALVALYITFEAPLSGMSINPARTVASSVFARDWSGWWIYLSAPLLGMLAASEAHLRTTTARTAGCAKLHHCHLVRCIHCGLHCQP